MKKTIVITILSFINALLFPFTILAQDGERLDNEAMQLNKGSWSDHNRIEIGAGAFWRENWGVYDNGTRFHLSYYRLLSTEKGWFAKGTFALIDLECSGQSPCLKDGQKFNFKQAELAFGRQFRLGKGNHLLMPSLGLARLYGLDYQAVLSREELLPNGEAVNTVVVSESSFDSYYAPMLTMDYKLDMKVVCLGIYGQYFQPFGGWHVFTLGATVSQSF